MMPTPASNPELTVGTLKNTRYNTTFCRWCQARTNKALTNNASDVYHDLPNESYEQHVLLQP